MEYRHLSLSINSHHDKFQNPYTICYLAGYCYLHQFLSNFPVHNKSMALSLRRSPYIHFYLQLQGPHLSKLLLFRKFLQTLTPHPGFSILLVLKMIFHKYKLPQDKSRSVHLPDTLYLFFHES